MRLLGVRCLSDIRQVAMIGLLKRFKRYSAEVRKDPEQWAAINLVTRFGQILAVFVAISGAASGYISEYFTDHDAAWIKSLESARCGDKLVSPEGLQTVKRCGPPMLLHPSKYSISLGRAGDEFKVTVRYAKTRDDCTVLANLKTVIDNAGERHSAKSSFNTLVAVTGGWADFTYYIRISRPEFVVGGMALLRSSLIHQCPEGRYTADYPDIPFLIEPDEFPAEATPDVP